MLRKISVIAISAAFAACLFGATIGFSEDATPLRVRGTLDQVNGNTLTIKTKSGTPVTVQLKDGAPVVAVTKGAMSDVQTNSFVGMSSYPCAVFISKFTAKEDGIMLRKISVIAISAAFAACVFGATAGFSEDATPFTDARHA